MSNILAFPFRENFGQISNSEPQDVDYVMIKARPEHLLDAFPILHTQLERSVSRLQDTASSLEFAASENASQLP